MIVIGAKGHAKEILDIYNAQDKDINLYFFDNVSSLTKMEFFNHPIISKEIEVRDILKRDNQFVLGLGGPQGRKLLAQLLRDYGGELKSVISSNTHISINSFIGDGVNIMPFSSVIGNAILMEGVLLNSYASVHHDASVGKYSELSPGSRILGYCQIGEMCSIGANAVILPGINICNNVVVGAGSVVTQDILEMGVYVGVPAKKIK